MEVKIKKMERNKTEEELRQLTKDELVHRILSLNAHNSQLKNIIAKIDSKNIKQHTKNKKSFNFEKCHFRRILLKFFYLGWDYNGYAVQEDTPKTIENFIFYALQRTCLIKDRQSSNYHRCGRTDKGVSSFGQVISLSIRSKLRKQTENDLKNEIDYCKVLNSVLPDDIQCYAWAPCGEVFSARFDCRSRTYKYFFPKGSLDTQKMQIASKLILGSHDFRNFCKMDVGNGVVQFTRNIMDIQITPLNGKDVTEYSMFVLIIKGNAFLWHQIRCVMAILIMIGQGKEEPEIVLELFDIKKNPKKPDYNMASEIPLNLFYCEYDDINWIYNNESLHLVVQKLRNIWTTYAVKTSMIKNMVSDLQDELTKCPVDSNVDKGQKCLAEFLINGVKTKKYVPLLKRPTCGSLEDRIEHFSKRKKIEILQESKRTEKKK